MRRRDLLALAAGVTVIRSAAALAQQKAMPVVGFLHSGSAAAYSDSVAAFRGGLREVGYSEGQNLAIEYRWAEGHNDRLLPLAGELVRQQVAVIVTPASTPATLAARSATATIPIVFITGADPVKLGLVASLSRPGGNITGISDVGVDLGAKRLGLLHELLPGAARLAVLVNPDNPVITEQFVSEVQAAASTIKRSIEIVTASTVSDIETAFARFATTEVAGFLISNDAFFVTRREQLVTLAARQALPAIYHRREFVDGGGLISYGSDLADQFRQTGVYVGRILKGAKPADLPVQQPTKFELVINLKTATALALTVPQTLLARADEVIE